MKTLKFVGLVALFGTALFSFSGQKIISKEQFGDKWPFTVERGILQCKEGKVILFHANGKVYSVNGKADGLAKSRGYHDIREIWKNNPEYSKFFAPDDPEHPKINIGPIIEEGLKLCD